jgi:hypothetical protein
MCLCTHMHGDVYINVATPSFRESVCSASSDQLDRSIDLLSQNLTFIETWIVLEAS